jgi:regulator of PEP synthase PpsR (kinase-PPPase family)
MPRNLKRLSYIRWYPRNCVKYLESTDYTDIESIRRELKYSQKIFRDIQGLKVLDVTNKSIEEIATEIMGNGQY